MLSNDQDSPDEHSLQHNARGNVSRLSGLPGCSIQRVNLCLGILSAILLLAAIVMGVYCDNISKVSIVLHPNVTELTAELQRLEARVSKVTNAIEQDQLALDDLLTNHRKLKVDLEAQKRVNDAFQSQIEILRTEKAELKTKALDLQEHCGRCLSGFFLLNTSCYFYSKPLPKMNWADSRADCISRGADLAVIDNWEEQVALFEYLPKVTHSRRPWWDLGEGIWIGFTDIHTERTWVWINNVTEQNGGYWIDGEPNNHGHDGEDCAAIFNRGDPRKTWFDSRCDKSQLEWLCEMTSNH